jgi:uridine phosphorylase
MGGPSAALVLTDLAKLGVRRAVRVGTCAAAEPGLEPGAMVVVGEAVSGGAATCPDPGLTERLRGELGGEPATARVASLDDFHAYPPAGVVAADLQTAALLARGGDLGLAVAAVLIVERSAAGERIADAALEDAGKRAGRAAAHVLST